MSGRRVLIGGLVLAAVGFAVLPRLLTPREHPTTSPAEAAAPRTIGDLYAFHFRDPRQERMFLASLGFFFTFGVTRAITHAIRAGRGPFHDVVTSGGHIHHLVWGILLLLGIGYLWLLGLGTGGSAEAPWLSPLTALLFGAGSALTLDEFALWLTFRDVYWEREGRKSIDAVLLFGSLLSIGMWGGRFLRDVLGLWASR